MYENYVAQELDEYQITKAHENQYEEKELPSNSIIHAASNELGGDTESIHRLKTLFNESKVTSSAENFFSHGFSDQLAKPYKLFDFLGRDESESYNDIVPKFIRMPELVTKTKLSEELDDYALMAGYALKDEEWAPKPIPIPVVVIPPPVPKISSQDIIRKSERNS